MLHERHSIPQEPPVAIPTKTEEKKPTQPPDHGGFLSLLANASRLLPTV